MSLNTIKAAIASQKMICPSCGKPVKQFEKYVDMIESAYDGPDSSLSLEGTGKAKVTLICANDDCSWKERTEYWANYIA